MIAGENTRKRKNRLPIAVVGEQFNPELEFVKSGI